MNLASDVFGHYYIVPKIVLGNGIFFWVLTGFDFPVAHEILDAEEKEDIAYVGAYRVVEKIVYVKDPEGCKELDSLDSKGCHKAEEYYDDELTEELCHSGKKKA